MDPYTEQLIERTKQRREMLNQRLGKTPDPAPRKRVLEDTTNRPVQTKAIDDDSPKRQCLWEADRGSKPDTPAVIGVKSRLQGLSDKRLDWQDTQGGANEDSSQARQTEAQHSPAKSPLNRKSRFAQLAQNLDDFECDMSHPTIRKQEEKKPRWQPPKRDDDRPSHSDARDRHVSSPRKEHELYQGPKRNNNANTSTGLAPSPKKTPAPPPPPPAPPVPEHLSPAPAKPPRCPSPARHESPRRFEGHPQGSPKKSTHTIQLQKPAENVGSPRFIHQVRQIPSQPPRNTNSPAKVDQDRADDPAAKPVTERMAAWKQTVDTPNKPKKVEDPTQLPISERFAGWEQRVSQTPKTDKVVSSKVNGTPRQMCTPAKDTSAAQTGNNDGSSDDISAKPVSDIRASWKTKDAIANPAKPDEPTSYSVTDRMSAWEHISSSNKVSYIKKVDPGNSPARPLSGSNQTPSKPTPHKPGLTPQKSFKDSIEEKAAQMGRRPPAAAATGEGLPPRPPPTNNSRSPAKPTSSPSKHQSPGKLQQSPSHAGPPSPGSPTRVGSATRSLQQRLLEQTAHSKTDKLAEKIRQERMAEVNRLNNRTPALLQSETDTEAEQEPPVVEQTCPPPAATVTKTDQRNDRRNTIREKAREDFNKKLQAMGFEISDEGNASYKFNQDNKTQMSTSEKLAQHQPSSATKKPSIYRLVSKKCNDEERPVVRQASSSSMKRVSFKDHNTSTESDSSQDRQTDEHSEETDYTETDDTADFDHPSEDPVSETQESFDDSFGSNSVSSSGSYNVRTREIAGSASPHKKIDEYDDVSLSAFVPDSVRRESILPHRPPSDDSETGDDAVQYRNEPAGYQQERVDGGYQPENRYKHPGAAGETTDDSEDEDHQGEIDDLLDEAMDEVDISQVEMRRKEPVAAPRKRKSHMYATSDGDVLQGQSGEATGTSADGLAYSVSMYRSHRMSQEDPPVKQRISRNSHYTHEHPVEEDIPVPRALPPDVQRRTIQERIKELQELVSQEQSVIMQTSNALNKCCTGDSIFAGSAEQVECNRLLLVACQKRQAYLTEVQRLKETGSLEPENSLGGPKGSLTISDIRLPLKKDFVTKIGTASDTSVHYFVILIRNGPQVIMTQMLSTHDPMMRGSLDFPNLIKIHGISSQFNINLEIYSMCVSREMYKDKKKKTPKKQRGFSMAMESPGGPNAVRTTSFTLITALPITMKCLDKNSFSLERVPFLSPLHGMIYMRLKCMMEQNVEERGFLTMFEDVSGLGSWHRRWCVLTGNKLCYWKYPDDETRKDPMGLVDLKRCITEKVGLIPRDICARPHSFELVSVRPPRRGEQDTLITKTYNTMTTTRFMLSADTKEERIVWCNKINRALANIRTWNADAMRPIKPRK